MESTFTVPEDIEESIWRDGFRLGRATLFVEAQLGPDADPAEVFVLARKLADDWAVEEAKFDEPLLGVTR